MGPLVQLLIWVIYAITALVIVEVIFTNMMAMRTGLPGYHPLVRGVRAIVNPMLEPIRRILPPSRTGNLDFSPMILILLLSVLRAILVVRH